jgi:uncharacterized protein (DUF1697 family)
MDRLAALFAVLRLTGVTTFIASGNVVFKSPATKEPTLRRKIEKHLQASLGYHVEVFLRRSTEVAAIGQARPFAELRTSERGKLQVGFMHEPLSPAEAKKLTGLNSAVDALKVIGREFYWSCQEGTLESPIGNLLLTKSTKVPLNTIRTMNTVQRMVDKFGFSESRIPASR